MKTNIFLTIICLCALSVSGQNKIPIYLDENQPIEKRVEDALSRMTLEEKVKMCHAQSKFSSAGVPRLGIPENWMSDGPHGIRAEVLWDEWNQAKWTNDSCIAFPALTCLAATWNPEMAAMYGKAIGEEARYRNKNVLLGPGVNIYRMPLNGRNFEYMGEDPYLASRIVVPYIQNVQKNGVAACVKHYALNNQETYRHLVNVEVSDRALYEIYLPAFKAAVQEGGAWAIMGSYNKYKGQWCCQNQYLLNDILRKEWNFNGVVISDWGGVTDTEQAIYNGMDMEFGTWTNGLSEGTSDAYGNYYLANPFLKLLKSGKVKEEEVDKKVRNILRLVFRTNMDSKRPWGSFGTEEHAMAGRKIAEEGIVLLQNKNNILPIDFSKTKKIAMIGENAIKVMTVGGGSSSLKAKYEVSPLQGIKKYVGNKAEVVYARGYVSDELRKKSNAGQDGLKINDVADSRPVDEIIAEACKVAKEADLVVFIGGLNKNNNQDSEGDDRKDFGLPYGQDQVISELVKANKNLAVVLISGNAVAMPWVNDVPAIVQSWYNGTEAGNALAAILTGEVNPSGKLPMTFPVNLKDNGAMALGDFPGDSINGEIVERYKEDIFVGYRWHDKQKIKPLFAFGHGLSYTTFTYGKASVDKNQMENGETLTVTVPVKNTGSKEGAEVVQLYINDVKSSLPRPVKELKAFDKVTLKPGEEKNITFTINADMLKFFDDKKHDWVAEPGDFKALIGSSSADIRSTVDFSLK